MNVLKSIGSTVLYRSPDVILDQPCLYAVVGKSRTLMIDGGVTPTLASDFLQAVRAETGRGVDFVAVTHWHWDHVFGLAALEAPVIGHRRLRANLERLKTMVSDDAALDASVHSGLFTTECAANIRKSYLSCKDIVIRLPDIAFDGALRIELGDLACDIVELPFCHTDDAVAITVDKQKVCFIGDAQYPVYRNGIYFYTAQAARALLGLVKRTPDGWVMDSHAEPMAVRNFLANAELLEVAADGIAQGIAGKPELLKYMGDRCGGRLPQELDEMADLFVNGLLADA